MAGRKAKSPSQIDGETNRQIELAGDALRDAELRRVMLPVEIGGPNTLEVGYQGNMFLLKRGVELELPVPLYEILEHAGLV